MVLYNAATQRLPGLAFGKFSIRGALGRACLVHVHQALEIADSIVFR